MFSVGKRLFDIHGIREYFSTEVGRSVNTEQTNTNQHYFTQKFAVFTSVKIPTLHFDYDVLDLALSQQILNRIIDKYKINAI